LYHKWKFSWCKIMLSRKLFLLSRKLLCMILFPLEYIHIHHIHSRLYVMRKFSVQNYVQVSSLIFYFILHIQYSININVWWQYLFHMAYQIGIVDTFYFLLLSQWTIRISDKRSVIHRFLVEENQTSVRKNYAA
jgi:hypothetical protein